MTYPVRVFSWGDTRRYNSHANRLKEMYGARIQKISVNAGFTCPNRDGTKGLGGCIYCNNDSFIPAYCLDDFDIGKQIDWGIRFLRNRYRRTAFYVAYFQAYTNTYRPLTELKTIYEKVLRHPLVKGLVIATRPDCVDEHILDYLMELNEKIYLSVEYGIESCYDGTLQLINRNHSFKDTRNAVRNSLVRGLHVTGHLLFGLPGETRQMMLEEAGIISGMEISTLKFHQLQIIRGTGLASEYQRNKSSFKMFSLSEYIDFVVEFIERLKPEISIDRLVSATPQNYRIDTGWGNLRTDQIQKKIESAMEERDTWQGNKFKK